MHGSHWPHLEDPEKFNGFLLDWLADVVFDTKRDERQEHNPDEL
jgi:hypothetical protein